MKNSIPISNLFGLLKKKIEESTDIDPEKKKELLTQIEEMDNFDKSRRK